MDSCPKCKHNAISRSVIGGHLMASEDCPQGLGKHDSNQYTVEYSCFGCGHIERVSEFMSCPCGWSSVSDQSGAQVERSTGVSEAQVLKIVLNRVDKRLGVVEAEIRDLRSLVTPTDPGMIPDKIPSLWSLWTPEDGTLAPDIVIRYRDLRQMLHDMCQAMDDGAGERLGHHQEMWPNTVKKWWHDYNE